MLRRRTPSPAPIAASEPPGGPSLLDRLRADDWVLPRLLEQGGEPRWSLVGTFSSPVTTPVDPAGLVVGDGWALDWWIGADDRWHLPAREAAVRQELHRDVPIVETLLRIPGGDAVQRTYGIRSPRAEGDEWVVAEFENATAVPFALTIVIRPFVADGIGSIGSITVEPVDGGHGRDEAQLVRIDGRPALLLPRRPARFAAGSLAAGDVVSSIVDGEAGRDPVTARCEDGLATLALLLPLTHRATVRAVMPIGPCESDVSYPHVLPELEAVATGWEAHRRRVRVEFPGTGIGSAFERARSHLLLASDGAAVRRDGHRSRALDPGATETILGALDLLDRPTEVGPIVAGWMTDLAEASPQVDALFLTAITRHWLLHRIDAILDWMLPEVAAAVERIDRAHRRGRLEPLDRHRAAQALELTAQLLRATGQDAGAQGVDRLVTLIRPAETPVFDAYADQILEAGRLASTGRPDGFAEIRRLLGEATSTSTWPGPDGGGRTIGHDLAASAAFVQAGLSLLLGIRDDGLDLIPYLPDDWYGGPVEIHDAPTPFGSFSFGVRWHGVRPALLWDLSPHPGIDRVRLEAPGLDAAWSSTELRGEALLERVEPPQGLRRLEIVTEHPDIDPAMRRPGAQPSPPAEPPADGGMFS